MQYCIEGFKRIEGDFEESDYSKCDLCNLPLNLESLYNTTEDSLVFLTTGGYYKIPCHKKCKLILDDQLLKYPTKLPYDSEDGELFKKILRDVFYKKN